MMNQSNMRKTKKFGESNSHQRSMPLSIASWIFGLEFFEYPLGQPRITFSLFYIVICLTGFCYSFYNLIHNWELFIGVYPNNVVDLTFRFHFYGNAFLALLSIFLGFVKTGDSKQCLLQLLECDRKMERVGVPKTQRKFIIHQIKHLTCFAIIIIISLGLNYYWIFSTQTLILAQLSVALTIYYAITVTFVSDASFSSYIWYSGLKFQQLNDILQNMLTTTPNSPQHKRVLKMRENLINDIPLSVDTPRKNTRDNTEIMKFAKKMHLVIVKLAQDINKVYEVQILISMGIYFIFLTCMLYASYLIVWMDLPLDLIKLEIISLIFWIIFYALKIFLINHFCAKTSAQAAHTGDIICELYEPTTSRAFRAQIQDFTLQMIQNPLRFNACGFFHLDYTFIHGVVASVTTYLMILIQFGDGSIPEDSHVGVSTTTIIPDNTTIH